MMEKYNYEVGDVVHEKNLIPAADKIGILRIGQDFRLKCMGCGHQVMTARRMVEKNTRALKKKED